MSQTLQLIIVNIYLVNNLHLADDKNLFFFSVYLTQSWYIFNVQTKCDGPNVPLND